MHVSGEFGVGLGDVGMSVTHLIVVILGAKGHAAFCRSQSFGKNIQVHERFYLMISCLCISDSELCGRRCPFKSFLHCLSKGSKCGFCGKLLRCSIVSTLDGCFSLQAETDAFALCGSEI